MTVAVAAQTLGEVFLHVAQLSGFWLNQGTATAGTALTLTDATNERTPTASDLAIVGKFLYIWGGVAAGTDRELTAYGTIGVFTWVGNATTPTTTSTWVRLAVRPQLIIDAIAAVTRRAAYKQALPYVSEALVTNNLLMHYGAMEEWAGGASAASDGFTLGGAGASVAREATVVAQGLYSVAVTAGAGAVATYARTLPTYLNQLIQGRTLYLLGMIAENVAADITVRVAVTDTAGAATNTDRVGTLTGNRWQELGNISTAGISVPDPVGSVAFSTRTALSAVTYADDLVLCGPPLYDYDIPATLIGMEPTIWMETGYRTNKFTIPLVYNHDWTLIPRDGSTARTLHFTHALPSARHLRINGVRAPDVQTTVTSNVEPNPEWLALAATVELLGMLPTTDESQTLLAGRQEELREMEKGPIGNTLYGRRIIQLEKP